MLAGRRSILKHLVFVCLFLFHRAFFPRVLGGFSPESVGSPPNSILYLQSATRNGEGRSLLSQLVRAPTPPVFDSLASTDSVRIYVCVYMWERRRHDAGRLVCWEKLRANKRPRLNKSSLARTGPPSDFSTLHRQKSSCRFRINSLSLPFSSFNFLIYQFLNSSPC